MASPAISRKPVPEAKAVPLPEELHNVELGPNKGTVSEPVIDDIDTSAAAAKLEMSRYRAQVWNRPRTWTRRTRWWVLGIATLLLLVIIIGAAVGATQGGRGGVNCDAEPYGYGCHCYEEPSTC
jgi:hypothetical protein